MVHEAAELEARLNALKLCEVQHEANLGRILQLLDKADARRREETHRPGRWNRVLDNLEASLDEAKARLEACRLDMAWTEREREKLGQGVSAEREGEPPPQERQTSAERGELPPLSQASLEAARDILNMPLEEIGALTLEAVALVHSEVGEGNETPRSPQERRLLGRLELANQWRSAPPAPPDGSAFQPRRQRTLRAAVEKIKTSRLDTLTPDEVRLVISCHALLTRNLKQNPREERLKRILDGAVKVLRQRHGSQQHPACS